MRLVRGQAPLAAAAAPRGLATQPLVAGSSSSSGFKAIGLRRPLAPAPAAAAPWARHASGVSLLSATAAHTTAVRHASTAAPASPRRPRVAAAAAPAKQAEAGVAAAAAAPDVESLRSQLQLYNTMARAKQGLRPRPDMGDRLQMYVCGVTVYDYSHIGEKLTSRRKKTYGLWTADLCVPLDQQLAVGSSVASFHPSSSSRLNSQHLPIHRPCARVRRL
jgi:hypothetical protein